ncbi:hypothetical protein TNCV_2882881 [Trichonephila clavipes]|nr:hypothetical protein TNCV_2882881 [Trichonephila clavipes]
MGSPHTNTIVITAEIESGFVAKDDLVPFHCSPVSSCVAPLQAEALMCRRQRQHTSSRRLVCRGRPQPGLHVNDTSWIHWSQHILTTQSERPN